MLRALVIVLLGANLVWLAWAMGWLQPIGLGPPARGEPERLARQVRPQALRVRPEASLAPAPATSTPAPALAASGAATAGAPASAPPAEARAGAAPVAAASAPTGDRCLQAGIFDARQAEALRAAAADRLPAGSWQLAPATVPGRWMVYMGRYPDAATAAAKRAEVRDLGVDTDRPGAALEPGISLGRFSTEEAADRGLASLARKGVRTARVVQERREAPGFVLRLPNATPELRTQLRALAPALGGRELQPCS